MPRTHKLEPRTWSVILLGAVFLSANCSGGGSGGALEPDEQKSELQRNTSPDVAAADLDELVSGNTAFGLELFHQIRSAEQNVFVSPLSISVALAMTFAGARTGTEIEMADVLHFTLPQDRLHPAFNYLDLELAGRGQGAQGQDDQPFRLHLANSIWAHADYLFLPEFLDVMALSYGAGIFTVDYRNQTEQARQAINDWVEEKTEGRIQDLIAQNAINSETKLVLVNAIYFNAAWKRQFKENTTTDRPFNLLGGGQTTVSTMTQTDHFMYGEGDGIQVVELPYDGDELSMVILLPADGRFDEKANSLDGQSLHTLLGGLQETYVRLSMPRFGIESKFQLGETLRQMGMPSAFFSQGADFSGMDGTHNLVISEVVHKSFVNVDENGTEAAAATAVIMADGGIGPQPPQPLVLDVNRPFLFLIRDRPTGAVLFFGQVVRP